MTLSPDAGVARRIVGFRQDEAGEWIADLECGHAHHVRHDPPRESRPWVLLAEGRASRVGAESRCIRCARGL